MLEIKNHLRGITPAEVILLDLIVLISCWKQNNGWGLDFYGDGGVESAGCAVGFTVAENFNIHFAKFERIGTGAVFDADLNGVAFLLCFESDLSVFAVAEAPAFTFVPIEVALSFAVFIEAYNQSEGIKRVFSEVLHDFADRENAAAANAELCLIFAFGVTLHE